MHTRTRRSHSGAASPLPQASSSSVMVTASATLSVPHSAKLQKVLRSLQIDGTAALVGEAPAPRPADEETYIWQGAVYVKTADTKPEWIEEGNRGIKRRRQSTPRPYKSVRLSDMVDGHNAQRSFQCPARKTGDEGRKSVLRDDGVIEIRSGKRRQSEREDTEDHEEEISPAYKSSRKKIHSLLQDHNISSTPESAGSASPARPDWPEQRDITLSGALHTSSPLHGCTCVPATAMDHSTNAECEIINANDHEQRAINHPQNLLERLQNQGNPHAVDHDEAGPTVKEIAALERVLLSRPSLVASTGCRELDVLENTHALSKTNNRINSIRAKFREILKAQTTRAREMEPVLEKMGLGETSSGAILVDDGETPRQLSSNHEDAHADSSDRNRSMIRPDKQGTPQKIAKLPTPMTPGTADAASWPESHQRNLRSPPSPPPEDDHLQPTNSHGSQQNADPKPSLPQPRKDSAASISDSQTQPQRSTMAKDNETASHSDSTFPNAVPKPRLALSNHFDNADRAESDLRRMRQSRESATARRQRARQEMKVLRSWEKEGVLGGS